MCASHALLTEKEEIMGLLLGDISDDIASIWGVSVLTRSDKRSDRVEISPEQLAMAADEATSLGQQIGRSTRVVGWYHSHPHITVQPSHIDLRTQSMYQQFDQGFVGLIFSVFNQEKDAAKVGKLQVIGFQSVAFQVAEERRKKLREAELEKKRVEQQTEIAKAPIRTFGLDIPVGLFSTLNLSLGFASVAPAASGSIPSRFDSYSSVS
ncbi:MAG: Mov34/MPN/PAD-1 family protein, partial [archaeon]|nr:Mov34/MPN/PAD-1 family protein [archaeon]